MCRLHSSALNSYFPGILNELPKCPWTGWYNTQLSFRADGCQSRTLYQSTAQHTHTAFPSAYLGEVFVPIPHGMALPLRYTGLQLDVFSRWRKTKWQQQRNTRSQPVSSLCPSDHGIRLPQQASHFKEEILITGSPSIGYNPHPETLTELKWVPIM